MISRHNSPPSRKSGFTLVELLVVIGIIALLISILLPALNKARRAASTVKCGAQMRSIGQALQVYAAQNKGCFPSPNTSGYHLLAQGNTASPAGQFSASNCPDLIGIFDWQSPLALVMNMKFNRGAITTDRIERMIQMVENPTFLCPDNLGVLAIPYTGSGGPDFARAFTAPTTGRSYPASPRQFQSYCAASIFMFVPSGTKQPFSNSNLTSNVGFFNLPGGYFPKLSKIGNASRKIFVAEGGRFATSSQATPDMDLAYQASTGGAFADWGPFSQHSRGFNRDRASFGGVTNGTSGTDIRLLWARHGVRKPLQSSDSYKFQALFFDGHVALMGDLEGSDPRLWMPKGTSFSTSAECYADVIKAFSLPSGTYTIGE